jgi:hypothetical protein
MTFENHERIVRFINASREQRRWLSRELSNLDARSENYESYESYQRGIRGAIGELDTVTWKAMEAAGMVDLCRTTVTSDAISAGKSPGAVPTRRIPAK